MLVPPDGDSEPMSDYGGRPVVAVMINAKGPYRFILDTGASASVIDSSLAAELSLGDNPKIEFRVGKVVVRNAQAFVNAVSQLLGSGDVPRGILNASSFPGSLVTFDYAAKQISFRRGALAQANGSNIFGYDPADLPSLPVKVADREYTVHLDTGAPYPLALPTKDIHELPLAAPPVQKGSAKTHAGMLPVFVGSLKGEIAIGEFKLPTRESASPTSCHSARPCRRGRSATRPCASLPSHSTPRITGSAWNEPAHLPLSGRRRVAARLLGTVPASIITVMQILPNEPRQARLLEIRRRPREQPTPSASR